METNVAKNTNLSEPKASTGRLSWKEKIAYGFGDFGNGFMFDLGQAYLTKFFTDVAMIAPAMVGTIFAVTKIFDAFMDPLAGSFVDGRKNISHRGKFRPVMMASACVLAVLTVITFTMPDISMKGKIAYALFTYMAWGVVYSFTNVPYGSLASVMTRNVEDRAELATTRQAGSLGAQLITGVAFIPIVMMFSHHNGQVTAHGYTIAAAVMALAGVLGFAVCYFGTKEHIKVQRSQNAKREGLKDYVKVVFTNKPLGAMILLTLFTISAMNTNNTMMIYFCQYNLGDISLQPVVNGIMMGASVVAILLIPTLVKRFGKKQTVIVSFIVGAVANGLNFILPTNVVTFIILVTIGYVALAIPNGITWAFVSDVIDYGEWHTGIRKEGITYAAFNFSRKLAQSLAAIISAGILGLTGYIANAHQSAATLTGIKGAMTLYPAFALAMAAVIIFFLYGLSDDKYRKIADDLSNGRWENGIIGESSSEE
ncbi:glycoside-pentoside-hexuronide (GPH):cation symporter [Enterococcus sp. 2201sp1_2201st1_B8_2201SCRN_220225]|uniref:glycoside-pentoside-hexuronide (GPH):cation symporter n=1 Tax=unclassified Enterococcus TaxID=2608891 RepID=UPI0034A0E878